MEDLELDQVTKVIGYHPRFLDHFLRTQNFIMNGDGPLPYDFRYYLAIIAAARHQCPYLIKIYEEKFIKNGCTPEWLNGLNHIPPKLYAIYEVNKLLAHRPWLLRKEHIQSLTKGKNSWSLSEVVHAIVLLSHFHSLSSFVFSCGLTQKLDGLPSFQPKSRSPPLQEQQQSLNPMHDQPQQLENLNPERKRQQQKLQRLRTQHTNKTSLGANGNNNVSEKSTYFDKNMETMTSHDLPTVTVETLMERMKILSQKQDECTEAELSYRFKNVEMQTAELSTASSDVAVEVLPIISHYIEDPSFTYQDFARRGAENTPNTFRIQDYSWDDHGYSLVNALYNDVGTLLDKTFRAAYNLTYFTMGGIKNVDTSKFRRAIWNYIQCIYGIRHDDYDYGEVNQLLDRSLKMFIKTACCFPERITKRDYDSILIELQDSEKVHVNLMIMAARNQAELLYALREIMRYMT